jgi:hypothetical protein
MVLVPGNILEKFKVIIETKFVSVYFFNLKLLYLNIKNYILLQFFL